MRRWISEKFAMKILQGSPWWMCKLVGGPPTGRKRQQHENTGDDEASFHRRIIAEIVPRANPVMLGTSRS